MANFYRVDMNKIEKAGKTVTMPQAVGKVKAKEADNNPIKSNDQRLSEYHSKVSALAQTPKKQNMWQKLTRQKPETHSTLPTAKAPSYAQSGAKLRPAVTPTKKIGTVSTSVTSKPVKPTTMKIKTTKTAKAPNKTAAPKASEQKGWKLLPNGNYKIL